MAYTTRVFHGVLYERTIALATQRLRMIANEVELGAILLASTGAYTTGSLASSIDNIGPLVTGDSVTSRITADKPYAAAVEFGAKIHPIFPKRSLHYYRFWGHNYYGGPPKLKFFWRKAGRVVYMPQIPGALSTLGTSHPGQRGKGFLSKPLAAVAAKYRMHIWVRDL